MISVKIKASGDNKLELKVDLENETVLQVKEKIAKELKDTPVSSQRLIYSGKILKDADKLAVYKVQDGNTIHMVKSGAKKPASSAAPSGAAISDSSVATTGESQQQNQSSSPQQTGGAAGMPDMASMLRGMGGMEGMGGMGGMGSMGGMGGMDDMAGGMSPQMLEQMYSNPMVQQMMNQLYSNPELMRSMIENNPMLRERMTPEMRQMLANPEFLRMATNPEFIRASTQMQSAMRNMQGGGSSGNNSGQMYNPWATNPQNSSAADGTNAPASSQQSQPNPFAALLGGNMGMPSFQQNQQPSNEINQQPPEERYRTELQQLREMGFLDESQNIRALSATGGNVNAAIEYLIYSQPGQ
ncbi:hypothetical protein COEREDRAFT_82649 [Coemansia reversa NRRL 1564]|uniref:Ubiquitin-domain-containing protein n=1 Tax=Coemansia reversa (strain ATCC 12441 / NRRL 1564) TaxID=763665 RepID=A0A2G5B6I8_COERN|nr:hypothetical protein COEREDRAFT_82649 [Coemansia reversa NRRL 1564]|eukprot:PIA14625.1 hypothetical protein COEREDRAFT_82649 [Coemansia reversa NRRL 1564]